MCKFTPLGFETNLCGVCPITAWSVNLPRWGLKPDVVRRHGVDKGVNLPRWGLKRSKDELVYMKNIECKFTPLGFETSQRVKKQIRTPECKFTPLGFETRLEA